MRKVIQITKGVNSQFIPLYYDCFSSPNFISNYGNYDTLDTEQLVKLIGFTHYKHVRRFGLLQQSEPFGFFHINLKDKSECEISGGIHPNLINSGIGIFSCASCLFLSFNNYEFERIIANVNVLNERSEKMLLAFDFRFIGFNEKSNKKSYVLSKQNFPNSFCSEILNRTTIITK